ncbi:cupin domain-containing protein [Chromobacterium violaceum]|uniref:cupin domain-containing protein n=1 Tax=Chromobacterium violaceum TaxID=536 RepID=UPI001CE1D4F8|nr:cupin domain-containing protein [Chromobacterium violaceum]
MSEFNLVSGISEQDFFANYWEKKPINFPAPLDKVLNLYNIDHFEQQLSKSDIRYPTVALALNGKRVDPKAFTYTRKVGGVLVDDLVDVPTVYRLWDEGHTIILHSLQYSAPSLSDWIQSLEARLQHPVQVNAYLSPPTKTQGFGVHYDTHDVFIVQIEGRKHWRIWKDPAYPPPLAHESRPKDPSIENGPLLIDKIIEPGEVLYIPRGWYHEARAVESSSLHLTIGVLLLRRIDGLKAIFDKIISDITKSTNDSWRLALSTGYLEGSELEFMSLRDEVVNRIHDEWSVSSIAKRFHEIARPFPHTSLRERHSLHINPTTKLKVVSRRAPHIVQDGSNLKLKYSGQELSLPISAKIAIDKIFNWQVFSPTDLKEYDIDSAILLCRHLAINGILNKCE